jgi:hypothetical protein
MELPARLLLGSLDMVKQISLGPRRRTSTQAILMRHLRRADAAHCPRCDSTELSETSHIASDVAAFGFNWFRCDRCAHVTAVVTPAPPRVATAH